MPTFDDFRIINRAFKEYFIKEHWSRDLSPWPSELLLETRTVIQQIGILPVSVIYHLSIQSLVTAPRRINRSWKQFYSWFFLPSKYFLNTTTFFYLSSNSAESLLGFRFEQNWFRIWLKVDWAAAHKVQNYGDLSSIPTTTKNIGWCPNRWLSATFPMH